VVKKLSGKNNIGVIGLAVMGENLTLNMASRGFSVSVHDRFSSVIQEFISGRAGNKAISGYKDIKEFVLSLETPRKIMLMIKAGDPVDNVIAQLSSILETGDIIIDGGNSYYKDTQRRSAFLEEKGLRFIGSGVSGGETGALKGPSIMPGGSLEAWPYVEQIFMAIAAKVDDVPCCAWMGSDGAGHFVKMVHNGIEYGDMQLICESYHLMRDMLGMPVEAIRSVFADWNQTELKSYLIEITADILTFRNEDGEPLINKILDVAGQKGTGKWTVNAALDFAMPLSLISEAVFARCLSSNRDLRLQASEQLTGAKRTYQGGQADFLSNLRKALYAAKIISYTQGFSLLQAASEEFAWDLDLSRIAQIWRGGCIIKASFLDAIAAAYKNQKKLSNLLFDSFFKEQLASSQASLRRVNSAGIMAGIPLPSHTSALNYYDGLRSTDLPANLLQAQRDYFGAHMYERKDRPRGEWYHTDWTGDGGSTTSTTY